MRELHLDKRDIRFGRWLVIVNGAIPAGLLLYDAFRHRLGANPANFAIRSTGYLALISLISSLAITPLLKLSGQNWLGNFRRALGLYAFYYALAHFTLFFWLDRDLSVRSTVSEMWLRKYLLVGLVGLLVMVPLAVTSTNGMIRRLGPTNWKRLHRLAYLAAIAGVLHFYMLQKADMRLPVIYASVLGALFAYRLGRHYFDLRLAARNGKKAAAAVARPKFFKGKLRIAAVFDETPHVRTFRLAALEPMAMLPFDFRPGQYLNLMLSVDGKRVNRSYTIASAPTQKGHCELTIKREEMGVSSVHLHAAMVGAELDVSAPAGKFVFDGSEAKSIVMLAGGVGVTPLMSKLRYLTDTAWPGDIYFIFSARDEAEIIFRDELESLAARHKNLHLTITLTGAGDGWKGERGRIIRELLERQVPDLRHRRVHVCGPAAMLDATRELLRSLGVPDEQVQTESFVSPKSSPTSAPATAADAPAAGGEAHQLTFSTSGKTVEIPADQTVLEAAEAAGVEINYDCRSGICGQCKVRLGSGNVMMSAEDALTASDKMNGVILACQAHCTDDVEVEV